MILLDPELEPDPATAVSGRNASPRVEIPEKAADARVPSARTLSRFLAEAQSAVRLRGKVTVLLTTDAAIRKLNRQFRGKNKATDVLSFPALQPSQVSKSRPGAPTRKEVTPEHEQMAGDLAVGVGTALKQAREQGHSLSTEIKILILHGLLHLAGYDHEVDEGQMARREKVLRGRLRLPVGLIERAGSWSPTHAPKSRRMNGAREVRGAPEVVGALEIGGGAGGKAAGVPSTARRAKGALGSSSPTHAPKSRRMNGAREVGGAREVRGGAGGKADAGPSTARRAKVAPRSAQDDKLNAQDDKLKMNVAGASKATRSRA